MGCFTCVVCGKTFFTESERDRRYCSEKCRRKAYSDCDLDKIKERNKSFPFARKDYLASLYRYKCAICGWRLPEYNLLEQTYKKRVPRLGGCEFHHIVPVAEGGGNNPSNLILLCPNHHQEADYGIIDRDRLLSIAIIPTKEIDEEIREAKFKRLAGFMMEAHPNYKIIKEGE